MKANKEMIDKRNECGTSFIGYAQSQIHYKLPFDSFLIKKIVDIQNSTRIANTLQNHVFFIQYL
jgi:hypothetical protein